MASLRRLVLKLEKLNRRTRIFSPSSTEPKATPLLLILVLGLVQRSETSSLELDGVVRGRKNHRMQVAYHLNTTCICGFSAFRFNLPGVSRIYPDKSRRRSAGHQPVVEHMVATWLARASYRSGQPGGQDGCQATPLGRARRSEACRHRCRH